MTTVVFSKDRAMQLHAFLRSYKRHVTPLSRVHVLYRASNSRHAYSYAEVFSTMSFANPMPEEGSFKQALLWLLPSSGAGVFFVDDQLFIRDWRVLEEHGLSLRLGLHLTRNYASNDAPQPLPPYHDLPDGRVTWQWSDGVMAWNYPLSVDGHVYDLAQLRPIIEGLSFRSPNTLESELQRHLQRFIKQQGSCYRESKVVNVPWNIVQTDWYNRHANASDVDQMLQQWESGHQIDLEGIDGVLNSSVHEEFPLVLEQR